MDDPVGLDTDRTVAWEESVAGHLAALVALTAPVVRYGATDLTAAGPGRPEAHLVAAAPPMPRNTPAPA